MRTKLQVMESHCGGFQASAHDSIVYSSSSSVNGTGHLTRDVLPLSTQQALYHTMGDDLLPFSSATSPSLHRILQEDTALISHHLIRDAKTPSQFMPLSGQEQRAQTEDQASLVASVLPTYGSIDTPSTTYTHHHQIGPFQPYAAAHLARYLFHASVGNGPYNSLFRQVQHDQHRSHVAPENLLNIKDHLQVQIHPNFIANDAQDSNATSLFNRPANGTCLRNPPMAPLATSTSSSSSSTPPNISSEQLTRLANKNLQAWMAYESNSLKSKEDTLMNVNISSNGIENAQNHAKKKRTNPTQEQKKKRRKRRRISYKNVEEMETQRMTHIAVERNRRKQMNDHLRALRLLMPQSYIQRGDQASIVGATIRFVEELQQVLQSLRLQKHLRGRSSESYKSSDSGILESDKLVDEAYNTDTQSFLTNVEVTMLASSTFFMRVEAQKSPHQLLHTLFALSNLSLRVTHLNVTTMGFMNVFTFNLEADDGDFQLLTPLELAELVKHMLCVKSITKLREE